MPLVVPLQASQYSYDAQLPKDFAIQPRISEVNNGTPNCSAFFCAIAPKVFENELPKGYVRSKNNTGSSLSF